MSSKQITQLNVAHIVYFMGHGGLEYRILRLMRAWASLPVRFHIISLRAPTAPIERVALPESAEYLELNSIGGTDFRVISRLRNYLRSRRVHILHTHNWVTMLEGITAARLDGVPLVFHGEHGSHPFEKAARKLPRTLVQAALARLANGIVSVNQPIADSIFTSWKMARNRVHVIENGVDLVRFSADRKPHDGFVIGSIGRLVEVKDFPTLLNAIALIRDRRPRFSPKCSIVGSGPAYSELLDLIARHKLDNVCCLEGATSTPEQWYPRFDAFVNCSTSEGMSNTVLEAMASGLPLVCSDIPGHRAWIASNSNALYFRPGDAADLAERITTLIESPSLATNIGLANRALVEQRFSNQAFIERYVALYRSELETHGMHFEGFDR